MGKKQTIKDVQKEYNKKVIEFFDKHIEGKDLDTVLAELSKKVVIELASSLAKLMVISDSIKIIKTAGFSPNNKQQINKTTCAIDSVCNELENILIPIVNVLK